MTTKNWLVSKALPGSPVNDSPLAQICAAFGHLLHRSGIPVTPERSVRFASAIELAQPTQLDELYWLARVTLLSDIRGVEAFDRVFQQVFRGIFDFADFRGDSSNPAPLSATPAGERSPGTPKNQGRVNRIRAEPVQHLVHPVVIAKMRARPVFWRP